MNPEARENAVMAILDDAGCLPYLARVSAFMPESRPYPRESPEFQAFKAAEADAERRNRQFAQRLIAAAQSGRGEEAERERLRAIVDEFIGVVRLDEHDRPAREGFINAILGYEERKP